MQLFARVLVYVCLFGLVFFSWQSLKAEETNSVFMDEGDSDFEMPKFEPAKTNSQSKTKATTSSKRKTASDEDDDTPKASTKGDAFDQMKTEDSTAAENSPDKSSVKMNEVTTDDKKSEETLSQKSKKSEKKTDKKSSKKPTKKHDSVDSVAKIETDSSQKSGFKLLKSANCNMYREPSDDSTILLSVKGPKKLWVEYENENWFKAFHKKGNGYLSASCF